MNTQARILYFPHGGGPLPLLGDPGHALMVEFLKTISRTLGNPSAILVISAHWEERVPTITSGPAPELFYDYYGFPEAAYEIRYPAPGHPGLAKAVATMLRTGGFDVRLDDRRGFDHGLFVPLKIMYPEATIPCIQLSLVSGLDPETHLRLGRAMRPLREQDVLVIGSGFSYHNLRAFFTHPGGADDPENEAFQQWLLETCTRERSREQREQELANWEHAPFARYCHPREEHLIPLHVCAGIGGTAAQLVFDGEVLGKRSIGLLW